MAPPVRRKNDPQDDLSDYVSGRRNINNQYDYAKIEQMLQTAQQSSQIMWGEGKAFPLVHQARNERMLRLLKKYGGNIDAKNNKGLTKLQLAVNDGNDYLVGALLRLGADPNVQDHFERTPLERAETLQYQFQDQKDEKYSKIVRLLENPSKDKVERAQVTKSISLDDELSSHISGHRKDEKDRYNYVAIRNLLETAYHSPRGIQWNEGTKFPLVHEAHNARTLELLKEYGADLNVKNHEGQTKLHLAVDDQNEYLVKVLLNLGVDPNIQDHSGTTALDIAKRKHNFKPRDEERLRIKKHLEEAIRTRPVTLAKRSENPPPVLSQYNNFKKKRDLPSGSSSRPSSSQNSEGSGSYRFNDSDFPDLSTLSLGKKK